MKIDFNRQINRKIQTALNGTAREEIYPAVGCGYGLSCGRAVLEALKKTPGTSIFRIYISRRKCLSGSYFLL